MLRAVSPDAPVIGASRVKDGPSAVRSMTTANGGAFGAVIDASFQALVDGIVYRLVTLGVPAQ